MESLLRRTAQRSAGFTSGDALLRVMHIITGLETGGAEMMLYRLIEPLSALGVENQVISITDDGPVGDRMRAKGIAVEVIPLASFGRLVTRIRRDAPDIVQTWMYHANLFGGVAARISRSKAKISWNIRNSTLDPKLSKRLTRFVSRASAAMSKIIPDKIIVCAKSAAEIHSALGYDRERMVVVPNGIDTDQFKNNSKLRRSVRQELGIADDSIVIGLAARYDPQKDHATFILAAANLIRRVPDCLFLLWGKGIAQSNVKLMDMMKKAGVTDRFILLGERSDVDRVYAATDIATSSSAYGEAFSLALTEAMSMELPCVVTNVGDSARLVGNTGLIVPPRDPGSLAQAWRSLIKDGVDKRSTLGRAARDRIERNFTLERSAKRYHEIYQELMH